nr:hypothetical protein [Candidatus Sigynarchaeota archaeon]
MLCRPSIPEVTRPLTAEGSVYSRPSMVMKSTSCPLKKPRQGSILSGLLHGCGRTVIPT